MKKKILSVLFLAAAITLMGCGETGGSNQTPAPQDSSESAAEVTESTETEETEDSKEEAAPEKEMTFSGITAVDNDVCTVKITEIKPDGVFGCYLKAEMENKTEDQTLSISVLDASVNGVEVDPLFATEVAPGKKANESIDFTTSDLKKHGIKEFTDIEILFNITDANDWSDITKERVHIYPYGEENSVKFEREAAAEDQVLIDNDEITAIVTGFEEDAIWGHCMNLFLVNKTDKTLMYSLEEVSVNGYMADPLFATSLMPGNCKFTYASWTDSTLEENSIEKIEEVNFRLHVYNEDDWSADDVLDEEFTVNP